MYETAQDHEKFNLGGKLIGNLSELVQELQNPEMSDAAKSHIGENNNDYANWIRHALGNESLADQVAAAKDVTNVISIINKNISGVQQEALQQQSVSNENAEMSQSVDNSEGANTEMQQSITETKPDKMQPDMDLNANAQTNLETGLQLNQTVESQEIPIKPEETNQSEPIKGPDISIKPESQSNEPLLDIKNDSSDNADVNNQPVPDVMAAENQLQQPLEQTNVSEQPTAEQQDKKDLDKAMLAGTNPISLSVPKSTADVLKNTEPRHFCPKFFDCTRREFLYGFGMGLVVGIVSAVILKFMI